MNHWINLVAVGKILLFGLVLGAAVPTLFALALRLNITATADGRSNSGRARLMVGLSWAIFALVVVVVITGVLFIANNFIGHRTGVYLFGNGSHK
ncbi:hypothetical protein [Mycolicibacterium brisbanense]|uniref:Membrane protein n=1 Tax=Mycolicibacterium brisbanense TaxID=146020 RepID=A0A100VZB1_9MYCO|nr:hypothetical protein [Mycolicibacterium brisbanense]MCV7158796.1 hypothetical protein [Mycolicibacterium brisbanense]GAS88646.1 membrane protein [Mycolicibacterium brisbanense]